ncbi:hypothetical protein [Plantactinospora sp. KBS50]|uniref:hypothetical protein n=1 Tax=Plantactinospora sp. KBS50 TaxID=2024580 RepID=UPI000BAAEA64|nr:hypothetical protein [Plantactinospora sp. KBS50]ASW56484.1 hypothetical protein CIK06_23470 [Plantactinospora sp. KBS50]
MGDLLSALPGEGWDDTAWIEYYDGDRGLAEGFAKAGDAILVAWQRGPHPNDTVLLPLIYNYRHGIELALKQAIRQAAACICVGGNGEPELWADNLETHLKRKHGHRLAPLATQLQGLLTRLNLGDLGGESMKVLSRIHQLDPTGEAFRYSGHLNSTAYAVDVSRLAARFREAFDIIHGGVLTMLDVHQDFLYERWEYDRMWG